MIYSRSKLDILILCNTLPLIHTVVVSPWLTACWAPAYPTPLCPPCLAHRWLSGCWCTWQALLMLLLKQTMMMALKTGMEEMPSITTVGWLIQNLAIVWVSCFDQLGLGLVLRQQGWSAQTSSKILNSINQYTPLIMDWSWVPSPSWTAVYDEEVIAGMEENHVLVKNTPSRTWTLPHITHSRCSCSPPCPCQRSEGPIGKVQSVESGLLSLASKKTILAAL